MTMEAIGQELLRHPLWEREIPLQMQPGLPYFYMDGGTLYLRYRLHRRELRSGRVLIFPDRYELELLLPERRIVYFRDLQKGRMRQEETPLYAMDVSSLLGTWAAELERLYSQADGILNAVKEGAPLEGLVRSFQADYQKAEELLKKSAGCGG